MPLVLRARALNAAAVVLLATAPACSDESAKSDDKRGAADDDKGDENEDGGKDEGDGDAEGKPKRSSLAAAVREATDKARNRGTAAQRVCDKLRDLASKEGNMLADDSDMADCVRDLEAKGRADATRLAQLARCMDDADDMNVAIECLMQDALREDRYEGKMGAKREAKAFDYDPWDSKRDEKREERKEDEKAYALTDDGGW